MVTNTRSADALRDAALELVAESGLNTLTLVAVAERAGVSRATVYREFGDKDGLVTAIGRSEITKMVAAGYGRIDLFAPTSAIIRSAILFALNYLREHRAFSYLRRHEPAWLIDIAVTHGDVKLNLVETVAAIAAPLIGARAESELALTAIAAAEVLVRTVLSHTLIPHSNLTDEQVAETAIRAVTKGIEQTPPPA